MLGWHIYENNPVFVYLVDQGLASYVTVDWALDEAATTYLGVCRVEDLQAYIPPADHEAAMDELLRAHGIGD